MKHHYETLGLQEGASQQEIRETFDRLSKELNPANNDNQEFFKEEYDKVQEAYKALNQSSILKNKAQESKEQPYVEPSMFRNSFSFEGRIRRLEYGLSFIIVYFWLGFSAFVEFIINAYNFEGIYYLLMIPGFYFLIAQAAKRCHDRGNSGWYQLIPLYVLWMLFGDGDIGANNYGANPKGIHKIN